MHQLIIMRNSLFKMVVNQPIIVLIISLITSLYFNLDIRFLPALMVCIAYIGYLREKNKRLEDLIVRGYELIAAQEELVVRAE